MWLPMWVFDGNGFTHGLSRCLEFGTSPCVWGSSAMARRVRSGGSDGIQRPSQRCKDQRTNIPVPISPPPEADFVALIPTACFCPGRSRLLRGNCRSWDSAWPAHGAKRRFVDICAFCIVRPHYASLIELRERRPHRTERRTDMTVRRNGQSLPAAASGVCRICCAGIPE